MGKVPSWPVVTGPLASHAEAFGVELVRLGFSCWAASRHMYVFDAVSRWLEDRGLAASEFGAAQVEQFLVERRMEGRARGLTRRGLAPMLGFLEASGVLPVEPSPGPASPVDVLVAEFVAHLADQRGLSPKTIVGYEREARSLLAACVPAPASPGGGVGLLEAAAVTAFVLARCSSVGVGAAGNVVTSVRALLRFLHLRGYTTSLLADCVPTAASWRDSGRSRGLEASQVKRLLAACDPATAVGCRDFAVVTLLARLGLRAGEAAVLCLEDIDWRAGELTVTGKGGRRDRLPVPVDVGDAIADYCQRARPSTSSRTVFVHGRAPYGPLGPSAVCHIVVRAGQRSGLGPVGAHRLRHTAATAMRRAGAPMAEIGQVLRHRFVVTTAIYAKDDLEALAQIARPWPAVTK